MKGFEIFGYDGFLEHFNYKYDRGNGLNQLWDIFAEPDEAAIDVIRENMNLLNEPI